MKITKRQLRQIIKEEKAKLLKESVAEMTHYESAMLAAADKLADMFANDMLQAAQDEPSMISTSFGEWEAQVGYAQQELESALEMAMSDAIEEIESKLHNGDYYPMVRR